MRAVIPKFKGTSLRSKIIVILSIVVGGYAISDHLIQRMTVLKTFEELEHSKAQKATVRVKKALEDELEVLDGRAIDWAQADGTAEFIEKKRPSFELQRLSDGVLDREGLDLLYFCDSKGSVVWGEYYHSDLGASSTTQRLERLPPVGETLPGELLTGWRPEDIARGIIRDQRGFLDTELGPLLVCTRTVARSSGAGGRCGIVVLGRFLTTQMIEDVEDRTEAVRVEAWFHEPETSPAKEREYVASFNGRPLIIEQDEDWLQVYHLIDARLGPNQLLLSAEVDREISYLGNVTVEHALKSTLAAGLVLLFVLIGLLQKTVLSPISSLMKNAVRIGADDTANVRFDLSREDEIGVLSREFDQMMEKLAASRAALVDTAREAGKSEIASGILHNVGNVLNSVNVSSSMLAKKAEALATSDLEALNGIITENSEDLSTFIADDPRGKHFPPFLNALTEQMALGKAGIVDEIQSLSQGIDRIRDLVNSQQEFVSRKEVIESVDVTALADHALAVCENVDSFHRGFHVKCEYTELPKVPIDRYKTLEILVNLIQNSRHAMESSESELHELTVRVHAPDEGHVCFEVSDTGIGIDAEQMQRVFDHGYTTKANGHGFGLHSAANAATEMNGSLSAHSDGPGQGARFVLEIPTRVSQETL